MPEDNYYLATAVRELDRIAIKDKGIPGFTLMQRAAQAALNTLLDKWPETKHILCFCGSGNNGGDGYVLAALAIEKGIQTTVVAVGNTTKIIKDARLAFEMAVDRGAEIIPFQIFDIDEFLQVHEDCITVDAMLGTGLTGNVTGVYLKAIELINATPFPVLAIDMPSGLCSDTGKLLGDAVLADMTVTFIGRKLGQVIEKGPQTCGEIRFDDLGVPGEIYNLVAPVTR